jgi:hypothetical protein
MPEASPSCDPRASPATFGVSLRHAHDSFATRDDTRAAGALDCGCVHVGDRVAVGGADCRFWIFATMYFWDLALDDGWPMSIDSRAT